jgi:hypothetical protein
MHRVIIQWAAAAGVMLALLSSRGRAAEEESIDVVVHPRVPAKSLSTSELEALFTRAQTRWSDGKPVVPLSFPTGSTLRERFDRAVLRLDPKQVARFWLDQRIRGLGQPPKQALNTAMMLKVVANLPGGIGYVPTLKSPSGVRVVARIVQGKVSSP